MGSAEWYAQLVRGHCVVDIYENYVKQSCRNRCEIMTAGGVVALTANVVNGRSYRKRPLCQIELDYTKRWQHRHWVSLVSAYRKSAYFDYFCERFEPLYERNHRLLVDFDMELMELMCSVLNVPMPAISDRYVVAQEGDCDLRGYDFLSSGIEARSRIGQPSASNAGVATKPYTQVFTDTQPFAAGLSIADLFFCEGPDSLTERLAEPID